MWKGWNRAKGGIKRILRWIGRFVKSRYKSLLYYAAMVLVLALVASAAEKYRTKDEDIPETLPSDVAQETVSAVETEIVYPEEMRLLRGFSDQPIWNDVLLQWEIHAACDYALADDRVICLASGSVRDVGQSSINGGYIEIEAEDGRIYRYASVKPMREICVGDAVYAGEIIAEADDGMVSELTFGRHLHLEVYDDGILTDFEQICGKNACDAD